MAQSLWPVKWPSSVDLDTIDPEHKDAAEMFAAMAMHHLTGRRVGIVPVTVMPCSRRCKHPYDYGIPFHPILMDSGQIANCFCHGGCSCDNINKVELEMPVGEIYEVRVNGEIVPNTSYRVENGRWLVRTDGKDWPSCAGDNFTVRYNRAYAPDTAGEIAAGLMAAEYLKLLADDRKCRLPVGVTSIARAGVNIEIQTGMFPGGVTGMRDVDTYLLMWNPNGIRVAPTVHSPDRKRNRQITWGAR